MKVMATVDNRVRERHEWQRRAKDSAIIEIIDEYVMKVTKEHEVIDSESMILRKAFGKFIQDFQKACEEENDDLQQ